MNFNFADWKEFKLQKLFTIKKGKRLTSYDQIDGYNNYVGAIDSNNGVSNHIAQSPIHQGNTISLSYNGSVGEAFYQYEPYWATDDVNVLYPKFKGFNPYIGFFVCTILRKEKYKYSYGRKWTLYLMNNTVIKLPVLKKDNKFVIDDNLTFSSEGFIPDWQFMEQYIKSLHCKIIKTNNVSNDIKINPLLWKEFSIGGKNGIFTCSTTPLSIKDELVTGSCPLVSRTAVNNGIDGYFYIDSDKISEGNCITIGAEGIYAFYQQDSFGTGNKVYTLRNNRLNKFNALFIITILNKEDYRYSYGRARILGKLVQEKIKLPAILNPQTNKYEPDWQFMEDYIKSLPYGDRI